MVMVRWRQQRAETSSKLDRLVKGMNKLWISEKECNISSSAAAHLLPEQTQLLERLFTHGNKKYRVLSIGQQVCQ